MNYFPQINDELFPADLRGFDFPQIYADLASRRFTLIYFPQIYDELFPEDLCGFVVYICDNTSPGSLRQTQGTAVQVTLIWLICNDYLVSQSFTVFGTEFFDGTQMTLNW